MDVVRQVAQAVLYEGYLLWPYRRSALKNQHRWTIGGVYPRAVGGAYRAGPHLSKTQCLVEADPDDTVDVRVCFLQVVVRNVGRMRLGRLEPVPELVVGTERYLPWEEATEREVPTGELPLGKLAEAPCHVPVRIAADRRIEWVRSPDDDRREGALLRQWQELHGRLDVAAERVEPGLYRLTVRVVNTTAWYGQDRPGALRRTFVAAHTLIHADRARLVSRTDPPDHLAAYSAGCENVGAWPVLVGAEGDRHTMLSAPIILPDYPRIAPESPGDLFDATEIDQLLTLSILTLSDEERREMRDSDPRARQILDRCAALSPEELMRLHGRLREIEPFGPASGPPPRDRVVA